MGYNLTVVASLDSELNETLDAYVVVHMGSLRYGFHNLGFQGQIFF